MEDHRAQTQTLHHLVSRASLIATFLAVFVAGATLVLVAPDASLGLVLTAVGLCLVLGGLAALVWLRRDLARIAAAARAER